MDNGSESERQAVAVSAVGCGTAGREGRRDEVAKSGRTVRGSGTSIGLSDSENDLPNAGNT